MQRSSLLPLFLLVRIRKPQLLQRPLATLPFALAAIPLALAATAPAPAAIPQNANAARQNNSRQKKRAGQIFLAGFFLFHQSFLE